MTGNENRSSSTRIRFHNRGNGVICRASGWASIGSAPTEIIRASLLVSHLVFRQVTDNYRQNQRYQKHSDR